MATIFTHADMHLVSLALVSALKNDSKENQEHFINEILPKVADVTKSKMPVALVEAKPEDVAELLEALQDLATHMVKKDLERKTTKSTVSDENLMILKSAIIPKMGNETVTARMVANMGIQGVTTTQKASAILRAGVKVGLLEVSYVPGATIAYYGLKN